MCVLLARRNSFPKTWWAWDKSQWGANFHQLCQRWEMCQYLSSMTAKTDLWHNFQVFFFFKEWQIGNRDETNRPINHKRGTRLHSNLKHSACIAEQKPDRGQGEKKKKPFFLWAGGSLTTGWTFGETSVKQGLKLPFPSDGNRCSLGAKVDYLLCQILWRSRLFLLIFSIPL